MQELVFIVSYLSFPFIAIWMLQKLHIVWNGINVITIFVWNYFAMSYLGIIFLFYYLDEYRYNSGVTDQNLILLMHGFCILGIVLFLVGAYFINRLFPQTVHKTQFEDTFDDSQVIWFAHVIVLICIGIILLFINQLQIFPILAILAVEDSQSVSLIRSMSSNAFEGHFSRYYIFFGHLLPFICMFYFALALLKKKIQHYIYFIVVLLVTIIGVTISLERGPIGNLIFGLILVYLISKRIKIVPLRTFAVMFGIMVSILSLSFIFFSVSTEEIEFATIAFTVASRIFTGGLNAGYYYLEYFPTHFPFLYGATFPNPMGLFPYHPFPITVELMSYVHPEYVDRGIVGSMPAPYWAELYANFSVYGVIAGSFMLGAYYSVFHIFLNRLKLNPITIALTVWTILHFKNSAATGATYLIFDTYLVTIYLAAYIMYKIHKKSS